MRASTLLLGTLLITTAGAAQAATSPTEERVGVGIGATVGAVAGGPVGALLGAAIGAKLGDNYARKNDEIETLTASLDQESARVASLESTVAERNRDVARIDGELRRLQAEARPELLALLQAGIEMDLLFRTDEHVLADETAERLRQLAGTLAGMPDVRVQLDGYADERGDEAYNQVLSEKRAVAIRELLVESGVASDRIQVSAHGERPATDASIDSYALARKVSLTLTLPRNALTAQNP